MSEDKRFFINVNIIAAIGDKLGDNDVIIDSISATIDPVEPENTKRLNYVKESVRYDLAALAHDMWSGWMKYMFGKCTFNKRDDGMLQAVIPPASVARWTRQMITPFGRLPENEKKSDYEQADKMIDVFFGTSEQE